MISASLENIRRHSQKRSGTESHLLTNSVTALSGASSVFAAEFPPPSGLLCRTSSGNRGRMDKRPSYERLNTIRSYHRKSRQSNDCRDRTIGNRRNGFRHTDARDAGRPHLPINTVCGCNRRRSRRYRRDCRRRNRPTNAPSSDGPCSP